MQMENGAFINPLCFRL